jgi:pyruvate formate lyase activating enzyme
MKSNSGIVFDVKKYAVHDGPGIRTTVFFKGCPMQCWWCHNPESRAKDPQIVQKIIERVNGSSTIEETKIGRRMSVKEVMTEILKDRIFYDESGGGVTFSGGEPLLQSDFLSGLLDLCHDEGIHTAVDTCGYTEKKVFSKIIGKTDLFLYDLKLMDDQLHQKYTGVSNQPVHENLKLISDAGKPVQIRIPIIPGITDSEKNLSGMIQFINGISTIQEVNLLPYHKIGSHKYQRLGIIFRMDGVEKPTNGKMDIIKKKFEESGYRVTIGG